MRTELWARGSFFHLIRTRLSSLSSGRVPKRWNIWLSTANEDPDDATAQWLKRKLDMETSSPLPAPPCTWSKLVETNGLDPVSTVRLEASYFEEEKSILTSPHRLNTQIVQDSLSSKFLGHLTYLNITHCRFLQMWFISLAEANRDDEQELAMENRVQASSKAHLNSAQRIWVLTRSLPCILDL